MEYRGVRQGFDGLRPWVPDTATLNQAYAAVMLGDAGEIGHTRRVLG